MRTLARWAARLYPARWRKRYAVEMEALLEDVGPGGGDLWDIVRGAMFMQMTSVSFWRIVAGCTLAGVLAAGIWAVALPERYVSKAVVRIGGDPTSLDRLQATELATLSRASLAEIIQRPNLNLYRNERKKLPMEGVIQEMRNRDLRIRRVDGTTFAVEFAGENPVTAQATVRALIGRLMDLNAAAGGKPGGGAAPMEVLRAASLPPRPEGPDRLRVMGSGLGAGLVLGLVCGAIWSIVRRRERWSFRRIGGFAAAGMALGLTIAFLIPSEFVSTTVLRTADGNKLQSTIALVLSDDSLAAIVRENHLYSRELSRSSMHDVVRKMKYEHIRVQTIQLSPSGQWAAFTISFRYSDRLLAQTVTRDLVARFITINGVSPSATEVLDSASPAAPIYPNRLNIAVLGTVLGILLGLAASRVRRTNLATA